MKRSISFIITLFIITLSVIAQPRLSSNKEPTHAANLNQHEDHRLAEAGPVQRRVLDYQSCHAGGGGGGEQRVEKGGALPVPGGDGQGQQ